MALLYKRSNWLWRHLVRLRLTHAAWAPLVELTRRRRFDEDLVERARLELERRSPDEFLLELTVLAHGRKREPPQSPPA